MRYKSPDTCICGLHCAGKQSSNGPTKYAKHVLHSAVVDPGMLRYSTKIIHLAI